MLPLSLTLAAGLDWRILISGFVTALSASSLAVAAFVTAAAVIGPDGRTFHLADFPALHPVLGKLGDEFHSVAHSHVDGSLHHVARLHELFAKAADIFGIRAAAAGDSPAARAVDD